MKKLLILLVLMAFFAVVFAESWKQVDGSIPKAGTHYVGTQKVKAFGSHIFSRFRITSIPQTNWMDTLWVILESRFGNFDDPISGWYLVDTLLKASVGTTTVNDVYMLDSLRTGDIVIGEQLRLRVVSNDTVTATDTTYAESDADSTLDYQWMLGYR